MAKQLKRKEPAKPEAKVQVEAEPRPARVRKGAPIGNQFWKLRSKHGVDALFTEPQKMWEAACEYFQWCQDNPLYETDFRGKDNDEIVIPKMRAMTMHGLCLFLHVNTVYFNDFESRLRKKDDERARGFAEVITRIRETIYMQKFEGAAAGFLNPNIIARDLGLKDNQDVTTNGKPINAVQRITTVKVYKTITSQNGGE